MEQNRDNKIQNEQSTSTSNSNQSYIAKSNKSYAEKLLENLKNGNMVTPISTGFPGLDRALGGGLIPGLYVFGAISALGKTTFAIQMSDNLAKMGNDILYVSLEMERDKLILKSFSRLTYEISQDSFLSQSYGNLVGAKKYAEMSSAEQDLIEKAAQSYGEFADKIYINDGIFSASIDHVRAAVIEHKKQTGRTPIVVIDYLQVLRGPQESASDKQTLDHVVTTLKRLSSEENAIIFAVSSLNRASYKSPVSLESFKESGGIEYTADILLGLQPQGIDTNSKNFDFQTFKKQTIREVEFVILKNRFGPTENKVAFSYRPCFNYFEES